MKLLLLQKKPAVLQRIPDNSYDNDYCLTKKRDLTIIK